MGLGVMAKGVPALVIPFGGAFICSLLTGNLKKLFKPINFLPGIILFLLIILPWHIIMIKIHGNAFFDEYIIKHHLHRFLNSQDIGRKRPFLYYFGVILWGFIPWIFSILAVLIARSKNIIKNKFYDIYKNFNSLDNLNKLIYISWIFVFWIMLFFSSSSTKLATYILPVYYPLAIITGLIWKNYIENNENSKPINISVITVGIIFIIAGIISLFTGFFLPEDINHYINEIKLLWTPILIIFGILSIIFTKYKKYTYTFALYIIFMITISMFGTKQFFELDYKFGQNDLVEFAKFAKTQNKTLSANGMNRKYSLIYYNDKKVDYNTEDMDINVINEDLERKNNLVILKKKNFEQIKDNLNCNIVKIGNRYIMIEGL
jgi:4-amino-4-deoxy-L-arabinose transferase-like glycosyltransferase